LARGVKFAVEIFPTRKSAKPYVIKKHSCLSAMAGLGKVADGL
jgi:hypothetical protein